MSHEFLVWGIFASSPHAPEYAIHTYRPCFTGDLLAEIPKLTTPKLLLEQDTL